MGCHTWFYRPITEEEREKLRSTAKDQIMKVLMRDQRIQYSFLYDLLIKSVDIDTDFWIENGWYKYNDYINKIEGKFYLDLSRPSDDDICLCKVNEYFHDNFRVKNYPRWVIHSRKELRRKMKKRYFQLTEKQLEDVSRFFKEYPGGVICFG